MASWLLICAYFASIVLYAWFRPSWRRIGPSRDSLPPGFELPLQDKVHAVTFTLGGKAFKRVSGGGAEAVRVRPWPVDPLALAYRGTGPYTKPLPLSVVTVIPSEDQMAFAVSERTGVTSLEEIRERRVPLRVSLRKQPGHSTHFYIKHILDAAGFSLDDIKSWGGEVRYDAAIPQASERLGAIERGEVDAVFDEAINRWIYKALDHGIRPLSLEGPLLARLEEMGFRRGVIPKADYPKLSADVVSLDFSGWAVFTRADAPDDFITAFCRALEARKDRIAWQGEGPLPLESMCRNTPDTPLVIPLHPAAERFWRDCGYLP